MVCQISQQPIRHVRTCQILRGDIDRQPQVLKRPAPACRQIDCPLLDVPRQRQNEIAARGGGKQRLTAKRAELRMLPARQGLRTCHAPVVQCELRLKQDSDLAPVQRMAHVATQRLVHQRFIKAPCLGLDDSAGIGTHRFFQRHAGTSHIGSAIFRVMLLRNADPGAQVDCAAFDFHGAVELGHQLAGDKRRRRGGIQRNEKLRAAGTRGKGRTPLDHAEEAANTLANVGQCAVAAIPAMGDVDVAKAGQSDQQHRARQDGVLQPQPRGLACRQTGDPVPLIVARCLMFAPVVHRVQPLPRTIAPPSTVP